ncbi:MAG: FkbM family methyltransferase [Flavobacteriaceae bacterium]|nr:FkbM family methyltransferase [Flavobacteriaceae bacterium]
MIKDCLNNYNHALELIKEDDVVLDLGANIGGFSHLASKKARKVYAIEAEPNCYEVLKENCPEVTILNSAVVKDDYTDSYVIFEVNKSKNSSCSGHTVIDKKPKPSRLNFKVEALKFTNIVESIRPRVLKIDIEGGEYGILDEEIPSWIKVITGELHGMNKEDNKKMYQVVNKLKADGWEFLFEEVEKIFGKESLINFTCIRD